MLYFLQRIYNEKRGLIPMKTTTFRKTIHDLPSPNPLTYPACFFENDLTYTVVFPDFKMPDRPVELSFLDDFRLFLKIQAFCRAKGFFNGFFLSFSIFLCIFLYPLVLLSVFFCFLFGF